MGKVALVIVGLATFVGMFVSISSRDNLNGSRERVAGQQYEILARNAALAGLNKAEQRLAEDFRGHTVAPSSFDGASYTVSVTAGLNQATVTSVGTAYTVEGEPVRFHIRAEYQKFTQPYGIAESAPPFLSFAVLSEDNLLLNGDILSDICDICVDGDEASTLNANMHTNGNLHVTGNSASVKGFGTHVGSGTSVPKKALRNTFQPNFNPTGGPTTQAVELIPVPPLDVTAMVSALSADSISAGDVVLSGDYDFGGTREEPYVFHVRGDLDCSGGTTLSGYVMFLVDGNVEFTGNLHGGPTGYDGPDESNIAFYAAGDVTFGGNVEVWGQVFAGGDIWFSGTPDVYGNITGDGVHFSGNVNIFYRKASPALTTYWNGSSVMRLKRLAYSEW